MAADLTIDIADESRENPEDQHVVRKLKASERVLTKRLKVVRKHVVRKLKASES